MKEDRIAVLAGDGILPKILANHLAEKDILSLVIVLQGGVERFDFQRNKVFEIAPGNVKKTLKLLQKRRINKAIMIGKIDKKGFIERKGFDLKALRLLTKINDGKDITIFHLILDEFKKIGVEILPQDIFFKDMLVGRGALAKRKPDKREMNDAVFGMDYARKLATMEIGQTVVVKNRAIIAVEAVEGTNETIKRGAMLSKRASVVCKAARANQDRRFDIPVVGLDTLKVMAKFGCTLLALEADKILMVDIKNVIDYANKKKISIIGI